MSNLSEIKNVYLVNEMTAADFGVYTTKNAENVSGPKALFLKSFGHTLLAGSGAKFIKTSAVAGQLKVAYYELNTLAPADPTKYSFGITIDPVRKAPGFNSVPYIAAKTYGNEMAVNVSGGLIDTASQQAIISEIVNQVYSDSKAIVEAGHAVLLSDWDVTSAVTVNGVAAAAASTIEAFIANLNATGKVKAYALDDTTIILISVVGLLVLTSEVDLTIGTKQLLGVIQLDVDVSFEPKFYNTVHQAVEVQAGIFPFLTNDEVKQQFANLGNHGIFKSMSGVPEVVDGAAYTRYTITAYSDAYDQQTPGASVSHQKTVILYVLSSLLSANVFKSTDSNNDAPASPDNTFDQLLALWLA